MSLLPSEPDTSAAAESSPRVIGVDSDAADDLIAALSSETAREILAALHEEPAPPSRLADRVDTSLQNVQYHLENLAEAGAVEVIDTVYSEKGREMDVYAPADRPLVIFAGEQSRTPTLRRALSRLLGGVGVLALASVVVQTLYGDRADLGFGSEPPADVGDNASDTTADFGGSDGDAAPTATETGRETDAADATETVSPERTDTPIETQTESATETATPTQTETAAETATSTRTETPIETATETIDAVTTVATDGGGGLPPGLVFFAGGLTALIAIGVLWYLWR